jgi:hypothetical protein
MVFRGKIFVGLMSLLMGFGSCNEILNVDVVGDGNLKTDTIRNISSFSSVFLDTEFELVISSSEQQKIWVEADSNLLAFLTMQNVDGQLNITSKPNFNIAPRLPVRIYLEVPPGFSDVEVINGGSVIADSLVFENDHFNLSVFGVSEFQGVRMLAG